MFGLRIYRATFYPLTPAGPERVAELLGAKVSIARAIFDDPPPPAASTGIDQWSLVQKRRVGSRVLRTWPA